MDEMLRIAVFGDSLMKGTLPDEQLRYHFHTDLFETPLAGLHAEVTNKSVFGATSRKGVTLVQRDLARGHRYDWALVEYGGNDCNYDWPDVAAHPEQDHDPVVLVDEFRLRRQRTHVCEKQLFYRLFRCAAEQIPHGFEFRHHEVHPLSCAIQARALLHVPVIYHKISNFLLRNPR